LSTVVSFDAEKASRYLERALFGFLRDPADSDFQRGFLSALLIVYREGLNKGSDDDRLTLLEKQTEAA